MTVAAEHSSGWRRWSGIALAVAASRGLPGLAMGDRVVAAWCGLVLLLAARALRQWAFWTLGRYFTFTVQTSADQVVVTTGPYRFVRHPAYTALLLAAAAGGLYVGNWLSLVALVVAVTAGLVYRITVEERALSQRRRRRVPRVRRDPQAAGPVRLVTAGPRCGEVLVGPPPK